MSLSEKKLSNEEMLEVSGGSGGYGNFAITIKEGGVNAIIFKEDGTPTNDRVFIPGGTVIQLAGNFYPLGQITVPYNGNFVMLSSADYTPVVYKP